MAFHSFLYSQSCETHPTSLGEGECQQSEADTSFSGLEGEPDKNTKSLPKVSVNERKLQKTSLPGPKSGP